MAFYVQVSKILEKGALISLKICDENRRVMDKWYKMDVLLNVTGPYTKMELKQQARKEPNFWVGGSSVEDWTPVDTVRDLHSGSPSPVHLHNMETGKARILERCLDELIGICKGIIADGNVDPKEAEFLKSWLENNHEVAKIWPANVLAERIRAIFADGIVDHQEQTELAELLAKMTGSVPGLSDAEQLAMRLPIDDPAPMVEFPGKTFCLTGKFVFGSRNKCENVIAAKGGKCQEQPDLATDYLVIGALGSREWIHSSYGRKIEQVLRHREKGAGTSIISEEHWTFFV